MSTNINKDDLIQKLTVENNLLKELLRNSLPQPTRVNRRRERSGPRNIEELKKRVTSYIPADGVITGGLLRNKFRSTNDDDYNLAIKQLIDSGYISESAVFNSKNRRVLNYSKIKSYSGDSLESIYSAKNASNLKDSLT